MLTNVIESRCSSWWWRWRYESSSKCSFFGGFSGLSYLCQKYQCDVSSSRYVGGDAVGLMMVRIARNRGCINVPMIFGSYSFHPLHSCHIYSSKRWSITHSSFPVRLQSFVIWLIIGILGTIIGVDPLHLLLYPCKTQCDPQCYLRFWFSNYRSCSSTHDSWWRMMSSMLYYHGWGYNRIISGACDDRKIHHRVNLLVLYHFYWIFPIELCLMLLFSNLL